MKEKLILVIKGFIMGIANIIPGVSGGTLAMTLGIYEQFISSISHLFSKLKENLKFLIPVAIGIILAIITLSRVIDYSFNHFPLPTMLFFVGLVLGGIPMIYSKIKDEKKTKPSNIITFLIPFAIVIFMSVIGMFATGMGEVNLGNLNFFGFVILFLVGMIAAGTMVIPGVSGSLVLMLLGYYYPVLGLIKAITKFENLGHNILVAGVFGMGIIVGIVAISKIIEFLFSKYEKKFYFGVFGFILASAPAIILSGIQEISIIFTIPQIIASIILLIIGFIVSYKLGEK